MKRVYCNSTCNIRVATGEESKSVPEPISNVFDFDNLPESIKIYQKKEPGSNFLIYKNNILVGQIDNSDQSFLFLGEYINSKVKRRYPATIRYSSKSFGILELINRGDLIFINLNGKHVGNIAYLDCIYSYLKRAWHLKMFPKNGWEGFEYDEQLIDGALVATVFMTLVRKLQS